VTPPGKIASSPPPAATYVSVGSRRSTAAAGLDRRVTRPLIVVVRDRHDRGPVGHHRGQMTVYLRLMGAKVPALYGPSVEDQRFD
jgi:hypothetical protein